MTPDSLKFDLRLSGTVSLNGMDAEQAKAFLIEHLEWQLREFTFTGHTPMTLDDRSESISVELHDRVLAMSEEEAFTFCRVAGVKLVEVQGGRWGWIDGNDASEASQESKSDAARDAIRSLRLLDEAV